MNLKDLIKGLSKADTYDAYQWLIWFSSKPPCKICIDLKQNAGKLPNCNKCLPIKNLITKSRTKIQEEKESDHGTYTSKK